MTIPTDVVHQILNCIDPADAASTLHSCLTINKTFFAMASARLYQDPFRFAVTSKALQGLLRWLLRLSPSRDEDVVALKHRLGVSTTPPTNTTTDYLGLVQKLAYHKSVFTALVDVFVTQKRLPYWMTVEATAKVVRAVDTVFWAICGHQLPRMREIVVCAKYPARYWAALSLMPGVEIVWLVLSGRLAVPPVEAMSDPEDIDIHDVSAQDKYRFPESKIQTEVQGAARFIKDLARYQEATALEDQHWKRPSLDVRLCNYPRRLRGDPRGMTRPIFQHLRPAKIPRLGWYPSDIDPDPDSHETWPRMQDALESIDLSAVETIDRCRATDNDFEWEPEERTRILRQCRSLRALHAEIHRGEQNTFDWAIQWQKDYQQQQEHKTSAAGAQKTLASQCPVMPLERLELHWWSSGNKGEQLFLDALRVFRPTLQEIELHSRENPFSLEAFHDLPRLRSVQVAFRNLRVSDLAFTGCPRLTILRLTEQTSFAVSLSRRDIFKLPPTLEELAVGGPLLNSVALEDLEAMPNLTKLDMSWWHYSSDEIPVEFCWEPRIMHFPKLRAMNLLGVGLYGFQLALLTGMPMLQELNLAAQGYQRCFVDGGQGIMVEQQLAYDPSYRSRVTKLLVGGALMNPTDLTRVMVQVFPELRELSIQLCGGINGVDVRAMQRQLKHLGRIQFTGLQSEAFSWTKGAKDDESTFVHERASVADARAAQFFHLFKTPR